MTEPDSTQAEIGSIPNCDNVQSKTSKRSINEFYGNQYESILDVIKRKKKENTSIDHDKRSLVEILEHTNRHQSLDQASVLKFMAIYPTLIRANQENVAPKYKNDSLYKLMRRHLQSKTSLQTEESVQSPNNQHQSSEENPLPTLKDKNSDRFTSSGLLPSKHPNSEIPSNNKTPENISKLKSSPEQKKVLLISDFWILEDECIPKSSCSKCPEGALDGQLVMDNLAELKNEICQ